MTALTMRAWECFKEEEGFQGRIRSAAEFAAALTARSDIFTSEYSPGIRRIETICIALGIGAGILFSTIPIFKHDPEFLGTRPKDPPPTAVVTVVNQPIEIPQRVDRVVIKPSAEKRTSPSADRAASRASPGGGNMRSKVAQKGLLAALAKQVTGKGVQVGDPSSLAGVMESIDKVILGKGTLIPGAAGPGRRGIDAIGWGLGDRSGIGDGTGGIGDILSQLLPSRSGSLSPTMRRIGDISQTVTPKPDFGALTGYRSKESIARVVQQNTPALRYAYNRHLREYPGLSGRVTIRFAIDELGKVIFAEIVNSTMGNPEFEKHVLSAVSRWLFGSIDRPGDVTTVVYPFVFSH